MTMAEVMEVQENFEFNTEDLKGFKEPFEELTDANELCDDSLGQMPLITAHGLSSLAVPSPEDEFQFAEESCQSPGLELKLCDIETVPPQAPECEGKLTVVFDLDETLVHARDGVIRPRPHLNELLKVVQDRCEPLIWTAGVRSYAERVVTAVDPDRVIKHCICRTDTWFPMAGPLSHAKDLRLLGRDMNRTIIIENTPDCVVLNPLHSIIVPDYLRDDPSDAALRAIACVLEGLMESQLPVPHYLATCPLVRLETLRNPSGETLTLFMLR